MLVRLGIYGPVLTAAVVWAVAAAHLGALAFAGAFGAGLLLWTALEYLMHRFAFHGFAPHWEHHERPTETRFILAPLPLSLTVAAAIFGLLRLATGSGPRAALTLAGVLAGYLAYELLHLRIHSTAAGGPALRALRRHHYYHHFANDTKCYGVTSPLWDLVFSSAAKPARTSVRLPETQVKPHARLPHL